MGLSTASTDMSVPMADLETGIKKEIGVTITTVNTNEIARPLFGRRKTTSSILGPAESSTPSYDTEEDAFTKVGNFFWKIHTTNVLTRYALYILPVATLLAIPLILTDTVYTKAHAGNVRLLGLFVWIEVIWLGLWVCKLCAKAMPILFQAACGLISTGIRKYSLVLAALEIPLSLFLWSIVAYLTTPLICRFGHENACGASWLQTFRTVFRAGIIVAAIFLVEKTLVQLISVNYHRKQYDDKIKESKKLIRLLDMLYDASRALFPEYCKDFEREDADIQGNTLTEVREAMAKAGGRNITQALSRMGRARDKATAAFGAMASDITGKQVFSTTSAHAIVLEALESEKACKALASRLWLSLVGEGKEALYRSDLHEVLGHSRFDEAEDIFNVLDRDGNGDVSLEEMTMFVIDISEDRKNRTVSMQDISYVIGVLDSLLSLVVLASIAFIYASFFSKTFASKTTQLWSTFTALGFAIGGTVTEFLACVIFIFIKHPYDIGDRVDIDRVQLIVERISLMYSVFRRIDSDKTVQIPHNVANSLWIENVSRSRSMKEQYNFSVCAKTTNADILVLRAELEKFVKAPENKRDFIPEIDIELLSLGDLKQLDLRVEIKHKSNFANEPLRQTRRNKFMVALLSSMRAVPINAPGFSGPSLGDPSNPSYVVKVSDAEASSFRAAHKEDVESKRLFPSGTTLRSFLPEGISSAFEPAGVSTAGGGGGLGGHAAASVTGRRGSSANRGRRSGESLRVSQESSRTAPVPSTFLRPGVLR